MAKLIFVMECAIPENWAKEPVSFLVLALPLSVY